MKWFFAFYRGCLSGFTGGACKYSPSCSHYADEAVAKKGFLRGAALAVWRILRCNPFSRGGYDPVE